MITDYTDKQIRIMQELKKHHDFGEWHAKHGINQSFTCAYCGRDFLASYDDYHSLQFDHITPSSREGEHTYDNTVACCWTCNVLKHTYSPTGNSRDERIADARRYVQERRSTREAEVATIRHLVRGHSPPTHNQPPNTD